MLSECHSLSHFTDQTFVYVVILNILILVQELLLYSYSELIHQILMLNYYICKVGKGAKIRNRYN